jgi:hypothetical protein
MDDRRGPAVVLAPIRIDDPEDLFDHGVSGLDVDRGFSRRAQFPSKHQSPGDRHRIPESFELACGTMRFFNRAEVGEVLDLTRPIHIITHLDALTELLDVGGEVRLNVSHGGRA